MADDLDLTGLALPRDSGTTPSSPARQSTPTRRGPRQATPFLRGPVPMPWLQIAMKLPGKAIHLGVYLWHLAGMRGPAGLVLNLSGLAAYGVDRWAASRALAELEGAKLVQVTRGRGRSPRVTILSQPSSSPGGAQV